MKKLILNILPYFLIISAISLGLFSGYAILTLGKYLGANMITLEHVFGCYFAGIMIWGILGVFAYFYILEKLDKK